MARPAWTAQCTNRKLIGELLPVRRRESHKGDYGQSPSALRLRGTDRRGKACGKGRTPHGQRPCVSRRAGENLSDHRRRRGERDRLSAPVRRGRAALHGRAACDYSAASRNGRCAARPRSWPLGGTDAAGAGGPFRLPCAARSGRGRHKRRCAAYRCVAWMCLSGRAYAA